MCSTHIAGTSWKLTAFVEDGEREPVIEGTTITASFSEAPGIEYGRGQGTISGSAGCNQYFGDYSITINPASISITDVARTLMACLNPQGLMEQEDRYLAGLMAATEIEYSEDTLLLQWEDNALEFEAI